MKRKITVSTNEWEVVKVLGEQQIETIEISKNFHLLLKRDEAGSYIPIFYVVLNMYGNTTWDMADELTEKDIRDIKIQITEIGKIKDMLNVTRKTKA